MTQWFLFHFVCVVFHVSWVVAWNTPSAGICAMVWSRPDLRGSYVLQGPLQVELCASRNWLCVHIVSFSCGSPAESKTPTYWNLIGHNMTVLPPVLPSTSIVPSPSLHSVFIPARKNPVRISNMLLFKCFVFFFGAFAKLRKTVCECGFRFCYLWTCYTRTFFLTQHWRQCRGAATPSPKSAISHKGHAYFLPAVRAS